MLSFIFLRHLSWNGTQEELPPTQEQVSTTLPIIAGLHFAVYIWARSRRRPTGTGLLLYLPKTLIGDHMRNTLSFPWNAENNWEWDVPRLLEDGQVHLEKIAHLLHLCFFAPPAVDWKQILMETTILKVTFGLDSRPKKHTQALNGGQRLQVQPVNTLLNNRSALGSSPAQKLWVTAGRLGPYVCLSWCHLASLWEEPTYRLTCRIRRSPLKLAPPPTPAAPGCFLSSVQGKSCCPVASFFFCKTDDHETPRTQSKRSRRTRRRRRDFLILIATQSSDLKQMSQVCRSTSIV